MARTQANYLLADIPQALIWRLASHWIQGRWLASDCLHPFSVV
jgi:hypothetical protein